MGWVSILHRVSGVLLFLALPAGLYVLQLSLRGASGFDEAAAIMNHPLGRLISMMVIALLAQHVLAGLRHLAMDVHLGLNKNTARLSAGWVLVMSGLVAVFAAWRLFG